MFIKIQGKDIPKALGFIKNKWEEFYPENPFEYFFLDDDINRMYSSEMRMSQIFRGTSLLAIFIACLGLFGLISFTTEQRAKEIEIRKVLGASVPNIVMLLSKEFLKLIIIANVIAWPITYFVMNKWLQNFVYRAGINAFIFLASAVIALVIAMITVFSQSLKTAHSNPVDILMYE